MGEARGNVGVYAEEGRRPNGIRGQRVMIIGTGQIGRACAQALAPLEPEELVLHALTESEAEEARALLDPPSAATAIDFGDVFLPTGAADDSSLFDYFYAEFSPELATRSVFYQLLERHRPDVVVDAINTATVHGYDADPYTAPRQLGDMLERGVDVPADIVGALLAGEFVPRLVRFVQVLSYAMERGIVGRYVKVSTTGLGGMGLNIRYTHGDLADAGLSVGIMGKVAAAGVLHQLLWALSHTPGRDVQVVVPAALVGWEQPEFLPVLHGRRPLFGVTNVRSEDLPYGGSAHATADRSDNRVRGVIVNSGENLGYSLPEMTAITALNQMEAVTKEEVAAAVVRAVQGKREHDILRAMDDAVVGPSYPAAYHRTEVLRRAALRERDHGALVATGNLGPLVAKELWELRLLLDAAGNTAAATRWSPEQLSNEAEHALRTNAYYLDQVLGLGLGVLLRDGRYVLSPTPVKPVDGVTVTDDVVDDWARSWWVDLRPANISRWLDCFRTIIETVDRAAKRGLPRPDWNWEALNADPNNIGEILAMKLQLSGGGRRVMPPTVQARPPIRVIGAIPVRGSAGNAQ